MFSASASVEEDSSIVVESTRLPIEVLCDIFRYFTIKDLLTCRFVSQEWNNVSSMTLARVHPPIKFQKHQDIGAFNSTMDSSTLLTYYKFMFDPITMHWRKNAVKAFISRVKLTAKSLFFVPREMGEFQSDCSPSNLYCVNEYGETLLRFLTELPNVVSFTFNCCAGFVFPHEELKKLCDANPLQCIKHLAFVFPYTVADYEPLLLTALLEFAPKLRTLEITFVCTNKTPERKNTFLRVMDALERLQKSVALTFNIELAQECRKHLGGLLPFEKLISLEVLLVSIDVKYQHWHTYWEENLWLLLRKNYAQLKSLKLESFRTDLCPNYFPCLEVLHIRRKFEMRISVNPNFVFENVRVFHAGDIESDVFADLLRSFKNLEEFRMECLTPDPWFGITGVRDPICDVYILMEDIDEKDKILSPFSALTGLKRLHLKVKDCKEDVKKEFDCILGLLYVSKNGALRNLDQLSLSNVKPHVNAACSQLATFHKELFISNFKPKAQSPTSWLLDEW